MDWAAAAALAFAGIFYCCRDTDRALAKGAEGAARVTLRSAQRGGFRKIARLLDHGLATPVTDF